MFQFYGANRTGRWAGRLIQLQNLPQNHMNDLDAARELVRIGDMIPCLCYTMISRIPSPNLSALPSLQSLDTNSMWLTFSAIEARVIAHLAGESWRAEVFEKWW